ncbi:low density lipoprotein receptor adapter protein 1-like [Spea bombifrons]|uniref:low density lipoprotein receptor adapter protein 1-like n=1 Tax=Spea bombifrons TaxID=233779 RepID=UPI00234A7A24|nr:low density lipoprotein receptor adapter protein 1-like [Spea bombifrons]
MDALRSAGKAILRSPSLGRPPRDPRHQKLAESWSDVKESLLDGMVFRLKYLGMTLVEKPKGEDMAAAAIRRIITMARVGAKKFQKVTLTVTPRGISLQDSEDGHLIEFVSIYRISYCSTDKVQNKVFAYVAQNQTNEALECHAFLSPKKKMARAVTLTVAQAFQVALDLWESAKEGKTEPCACSGTRLAPTSDSPAGCVGDQVTDGCAGAAGHVRHVAEEEDEFEDLDEAFSRVVESGRYVPRTEVTSDLLRWCAGPRSRGG